MSSPSNPVIDWLNKDKEVLSAPEDWLRKTLGGGSKDDTSGDDEAGRKYMDAAGKYDFDRAKQQKLSQRKPLGGGKAARKKGSAKGQPKKRG